MGLHACIMGANIISYKKNGINYGMCCAWAMQTDYDKMLCLLGSQSVTGKNIEKGDIIGISSLNKNQEKIAFQLGENHSDECNKFVNISYTLDDSAILINDASTMMKVEVIDIIHLDKIEADNLIYCKVLSYTENKKAFYEYK